ncbi:hypothetical protein [Streptomyces sp. DH10]|uniref:hypothetical protein n=1 Tax=Streptomyces sp. DH10 TaxID=3040121 RepID=UPI0024412334|nr:hypothetical protein [Streptomyces sp. DH10]MDG9713635.1 hypothetical protein [Streptomyces sp. DH10]
MNVIDKSGLPPAKKQGPPSRPMVAGPEGTTRPARLRHRGRCLAVRLPHTGERGPPSITVIPSAPGGRTPRSRRTPVDTEQIAAFVPNVTTGEIPEHIEALSLAH